MIKESEVLERIGVAIDKMGRYDLAALHNRITRHEFIAGSEVKTEEDWHLVPKEGAH